MLNVNLEKILFLDIETVPLTAAYTGLAGRLPLMWEEKTEQLRKRMPDRYPESMDAQAMFENSAAIFAEFGKIVCISAGFVYHKNGQSRFRVKSFYGDDEKVVLTEFSKMLELFGHPREVNICGHNIREFDIPYICRRLLINDLPLPDLLDVSNKKPWEVPFLDTLEMWKFGDYKNYTSLNLLTAVFDIPTPKDDIDGSEVGRVYYEEKNLERISVYCQKDVVATMQLFLRLNRLPFIDESCVEHVQ
jgi:predicted PolB exonuclease-like 3'-5' exonuclease